MSTTSGKNDGVSIVGQQGLALLVEAIPVTKTVKKRRKSKHHRPKDRPCRPLSAYNLFFRDERVQWLGEMPVTSPESEQSQSKSPRLFESMAKEVGKRWKQLDETKKQRYVDLAQIEMKRYREDMENYRKKAAIDATMLNATDTIMTSPASPVRKLSKDTSNKKKDVTHNKVGDSDRTKSQKDSSLSKGMKERTTKGKTTQMLAKQVKEEIATKLPQHSSPVAPKVLNSPSDLKQKPIAISTHSPNASNLIGTVDLNQQDANRLDLSRLSDAQLHLLLEERRQMNQSLLEEALVRRNSNIGGLGGPRYMDLNRSLFANELPPRHLLPNISGGQPLTIEEMQIRHRLGLPTVAWNSAPERNMIDFSPYVNSNTLDNGSLLGLRRLSNVTKPSLSNQTAMTGMMDSSLGHSLQDASSITRDILSRRVLANQLLGGVHQRRW